MHMHTHKTYRSKQNPIPLAEGHYSQVGPIISSLKI